MLESPIRTACFLNTALESSPGRPSVLGSSTPFMFTPPKPSATAGAAPLPLACAAALVIKTSH